MYPKIIICNETIYSRTTLKTILDQINQYIIIETDNYEELLSKLNQEKTKDTFISYIFVDLDTLGSEAVSLLKNLRRIAPETQFIISGGPSLTDDLILNCIDINITKFISKPFKFKEVELCMEQV